MLYNARIISSCFFSAFVLTSCTDVDQSATERRFSQLQVELEKKQSSLARELQQKQASMEEEIKVLKKQIETLSVKFDRHGHPLHLAFSPHLLQSRSKSALLQWGTPWYITDRPIDEDYLTKKWIKLNKAKTIIDFGGEDYSDYDESRD